MDAANNSSFAFQQAKAGPYLLVTLSGAVFGAASILFDKNLKDLLALGETRIALDISGLQMLDSSAVGAIISAYKTLLPVKGDVCLIHGQNEFMLEMLRVLNVGSIIKQYADLDAFKTSHAIV